MARPVPRFVTFEIDGREVSAPEGAMLVDGAKLGDVEIPYFCYEPKLGKPVGACRMCLVEIEGIPKLQTACSTPVKDGMVVHTTTDKVKEAQEAVVEFLLVNHPLDCPVCDKGGECPLQDISYGWGDGHSRFIEPKRHFKKPLELSPLVAIDRERCILCYRCVRFSQEISEDYQLVFLERGDHTYVGTHDRHPYVAPFSGNIIELCPVGALTSTAYRFRARPWDIEGAGTICTLCPSQCNVELTVRDDTKVLRVLARDHGHGNKEVDDGWLCDKGRFGYTAVHGEGRLTAPMVRDGGHLREVSWERALTEAAAGLKKAGAATAALAGGEATNEEGFLLQRLLRDALGSPHVDSRPSGTLNPQATRALSQPNLGARVSDIEHAGVVLVLDTELVEEAPILDLRVRKAVHRNGVKLVVATSRPSSLDANADAVLRYAPGCGEAAATALAAAMHEGCRDGRDHADLAARAGADPEAVAAAASAIRGQGQPVVLWGERVTHGDRAAHGQRALLALARAMNLDEIDDSGLIEIPSGANSRGLREAGCVPGLAPGLADAPEGRDASAMAAGLAGGELSALVLLQADPARTNPDRAAWLKALDSATFVVAFSDFVDQTLLDHASVVFPAEPYPEKEGTVTHPDGRIQRVRQSVRHPGDVRPQAVVLAELIAMVSGKPHTLVTPSPVSRQLFQTVPFLAGLTLEEIGGGGVRWQEREAAGNVPAGIAIASVVPETAPSPPEGMRLGTHPSLWTGREARHAAALRFLAQDQIAELSADDGARIGVASGDMVEVALNGTTVRATVALRDGAVPGSVFLVEGTDEHNATALTNGAPRAVEVRKA
ncbi:MAG: NADH-quinone oxidoreductase subunit [Thermoleophilaceae bacterium]|nr:NADH-quinone oxidoreductase subunit [Thermoleophilaceae bacterium]